jgi:hypothetical protein
MRDALALLAIVSLLAWATDARAQAEPETPPEVPEAPPAEESAPPSPPKAASGPAGTRLEGDDETTRSLERALVVRGGLVLRPWSIELEPGASYRYLEPSGARRDTFGSAVALRLGLPLAAQAEARVPFVLHDRQSGLGTSSGIGDVELGLTKLLRFERGSVPELLFTGRWKTATGTNGRVPTGTGANALEALFTAVKRDDPLVLLGSVYYVWNIRSGDDHLGDALGAVLAVILAATPNTSVLLDVDASSFSASKIGGQRVGGTDRLSAILEVGVSTIVSSDLVLDVTIGMGLTAAAPDLQLAVRLPFRL